MRRFLTLIAALWALPAVAQVPVAAQDMGDCAALGAMALPDAVGLSAQTVEAGGFALPKSASSGMSITGELPTGPAPAFCRIRATLKPSAVSAIRVEVWLPMRGWNGKMIGVGNFGWGGDLPYANMLSGLSRGYAVAGNDTGHDGSGGHGGAFLLGKPEVLIDYAWRANHLMTVMAKAVITRAFGHGPARAYWIGCSLGGLQGLIEARRFPEDYDGVVAGAPPNPLTSFNAAQLWPGWLIARDRRRALSPQKLAALHGAVLKACAKEAGTLYGYVEDPAHCGFDPASIACGKKDGADCLTPQQVAFVRMVYRGPVDGKGKVIFPGPAKGSEMEWTPFINGHEFINASDLFRYAAFQDPAWKADAMDWGRDVRAASDRLASLIHVDDDFTQFAARGGRLLLYVGGNDYHNPAELGDYLRRIHARLGEKADHYARMFVIPGMGHCAGSDGCDAWDKVEAIDAWVDRKAGRNPRVVSGHGRTQPLCYYPDVPTYRGAGDLAVAASYQCAAPKN